jgi:hypothetical protein
LGVRQPFHAPGNPRERTVGSNPFLSANFAATNNSLSR